MATPADDLDAERTPFDVSTDPEPPSPRHQARAFVVRLGKVLQRCGTPAHRLEEALSAVSERLGVPGQFFVTPTSILASFPFANREQTFVERTEPGVVDLGMIARLEVVISEMLGGGLSVAEAASHLDAIESAPPPYGRFVTVICFGVASGAAARFLGGGWREMAFATAIGLIVGLFALLVARYQGIARLFEFGSAVVATLVAMAAATWTGASSVYIVTLGGLIVLIPGLTLTTAMNELATRNLVAGTARLTGAMIDFLALGFGVAFGTRIGEALFGVTAAASPEHLPGWTLVMALAVAPLGFTVLFRALPRDSGWILAAGLLAFGGARLGTELLGPELGVFVGAFLVGAASNLAARLLKRSASVTLVPGIMLLVPGSIGFSSISSMLARNVISGLETAFTMIFVAVGLVTGLLVANVTIPPRKPL